MSPNNTLEVRIHSINSGHVEYTNAGKRIVSAAEDFAVWLLRMQESGMDIILKEKEGESGLYARAESINGILVSRGTGRFLQDANRTHISYVLSHLRHGPNAATMAYALPKPHAEGGVDGTRDILYFLLYSQPTNEHISKSALTEATGVKNADRAKNKARLLLKGEMEAPAFAPFVSQDFRTLTMIIFDEPSLARPEPHDFSTGIPLERGGGYIQMRMQDAYRALCSLHRGNASAAKLL
ncbi:hypothetical protein HYU16_03770 [Candidatus Woesearchaeota archaeon]|nr:hypothetical protein [Candidatus Woesearchaeota archaeon]